MARLAIYRGDALLSEIELTERGVSIGRSDTNDVVLPDSSKWVSRQHARVNVENGRFTVVDLNSQNGTWVGGKRVERAVIEPGQGFVLGSYRIAVVGEGPAPGGADCFKTVNMPGLPGAPVPASPGTDAADIAAAIATVRAAAGAEGPVVQAPSAGVEPRKKGSVLRFLVLAASAALVVAAGGYAALWLQDRTAGRRTDSQQVPAAASTPAVPRQPEQAVVPAALPTPESARPSAPEEATPPVVATVRPPTRAPAAGAAAKRSLDDRLEKARIALAKGDFEASIALVQSVVDERPGYAGAAALLDAVRTGVSAAARKECLAAASSEAAGDPVAAAQHFEQALKLDPTLKEAKDGIARVSERRKADGEDAFRRAKQYDALGRVSDAIIWYEKALQLLPAEHPLRGNAKERAELLRAIK